MERSFLKRVYAQKQQSSVQGAWQAQLLVKDRHHQVNGHADKLLPTAKMSDPALRIVALDQTGRKGIFFR